MNEPSGGERAQTWTVGRILTWCEGYFRQKGSETARLDAELLLARVMQCTRIHLYVDWKKVLEPEELAALRGLVARRARHEPVAYILGEREFWSMTFAVTPDVLIPRPETEHAVEAVLDGVAERALTQPRIADIGTGSGNIACALAKSLPTATICATDVSQAAVTVAEENARSLGFQDRIEFFVGDLLEPLRERGEFDVVVSNPPYVAPEEWRELPEDVRAYEPETALRDPEPWGLGTVGRLLRDGPAVLKRRGIVVCEVGARQADRAEGLAREAGYGEVRLRKDLAGRRRILVAALEP